MLLIGSHVSYGKDGMMGSLNEALSYGANAFMFYTGAPQNTIRKPIDLEDVKETHKLMIEKGMNLKNIVVHAPYIVNPASSDNEKREFAKNFLKQEIERCSLLGVTKIVLHPGSAVGETREEGLNHIVEVLDSMLTHPYDVTILIETMAGKGNELGRTTDDIEYLMKHVKDNSKLGVCLDTCHLNDSGVSISEFDSYLEDFSKRIGIDKIGCVHVNDSKNELGSHKDRHENIGFGTIGFENLLHVLYHPLLEDIPKILETPYLGENEDSKEKIYPPYQFEIEMIRNKEFDSDLKDKIRTSYKK